MLRIGPCRQLDNSIEKVSYVSAFMLEKPQLINMHLDLD